MILLLIILESIAVFDHIVADETYTNKLINSFSREPQLTLLSSNEEKHILKNNIFLESATRLGFEISMKIIKNNDILSTIEASNKHKNVINLKAKTFCNEEEYLKFSQSNLLCVSCSTVNNSFLNTYNIDQCTSNNLSLSLVLIDESIIRYNKLYDVIASDDFEMKDKVILCLPNYIPSFNKIINVISDRFNTFKVIFKTACADDMNIDNSVLAIVTHTPLRIESEVPIIFYNHPYLSNEHQQSFPNAINFVNSWHPIKYALVHFLKTLGWHRVAILSDDDEYSTMFLKDLLPLLNESDMVYTSQECGGRHCDFTDALKLLKNADARIIIVNVSLRNAKNLMHVVHKLNLRHVKWIIRDWPFPENIANMNDVFSITLSTVFYGEDALEEGNSPFLNSVVKGCSMLNGMYQLALGDRQLFKRYFVAQSKIKMATRSYAYVHRRILNKPVRLIANLWVQNSSVRVIRFDKLYKNPLPDTPVGCVITTNDFFKPCQADVLLISLSVLIILNLVVLVIYLNLSKKNCSYKQFL